MVNVIKVFLFLAFVATATHAAFGEDMADAAKAGIRTGIATVVQGTLAHKIGDNKPDTATGLGLHGLAGGLSGAILGGRDGILSGAVAAMVGEGVAEGTRQATFGKFMGAVSGAAVDLAKGRDGTKGLAVGTFTATTAVEENCMRHPEGEEAPDTDDEAEESAVGKFRKGYTDAARKLPGAKAVESAGDAIGDMMAEQASWVYAGEEGYVTAKLARAQSLKGKPLTPTEKDMLLEGFRETYQAAQGAHDMASGVAVVIPGRCTEWFLRHTGLTDKGTARAVGHVVDDALGVTAAGAVLKGTVTGVGKAVSKASNTAQRQAFQKAVKGMDRGSVEAARQTFRERLFGTDYVAAFKGDRVMPINGRMPINAEYAGKTFKFDKPNLERKLQGTADSTRRQELTETFGALHRKYPEGVPFTGTGHPDFSRYATKKVEIDFSGKNWRDFSAADKAAGFTKRPEGYTWHHHEDGRSMMLIPEDLHLHVRHTGGVAKTKM